MEAQQEGSDITHVRGINTITSHIQLQNKLRKTCKQEL